VPQTGIQSVSKNNTTHTTFDNFSNILDSELVRGENNKFNVISSSQKAEIDN